MWLRLCLPPRRSLPVSGALLVVFTAVHLLAIACVGVLQADSARKDLAAARSGPVAAEAAAAGAEQQPRDGAQFLRSSVVLPTSQGSLTWTRVVPWDGAVELPGVAADQLTPGAVLLSPRAREVVERDGHLEWLRGSRNGLLPARALAGSDELVVVSVLPRSAYGELGPFEQLPATDDVVVGELRPPVAPTSATTPALLLLVAVVLSTLGLARLAALSRSSALATLRLVGLTQRAVKLLAVLQATVLALAAGVLAAPIALALGASGASARFLAVRYRWSELVPDPAAVWLVVAAVVVAGAAVSAVGLRRLRAEPLAVRLRGRRQVPGARAPVLWGAGLALLVGAAYAATRWPVPDGPLMLAQAVGVAAILTGVAGSMAAAVAAGGRVLRSPLAAFLAGKTLAADPRASVRTVLAVGGIALAIGLSGALGPASIPPATAPPWGGALTLSAPDGDVTQVHDELRSAVGEDRMGRFTSQSLTGPGDGSDTQVFTGTCADLERSGVAVVEGACRTGDAVRVGGGSTALGSRVEGFLSRLADTRHAAFSVSGVAEASGEPWLFLATDAVPERPDTLVVRQHDDADLGAVLQAAARGGVAFEVVAPGLDARAEELRHRATQQSLDALATWLIGLAAVAAMAGAVVAVAERRGSLASLRYAGVSRSVVALSVGVTLATPLVIVAIFGGINGYVVGTVFGAVLDGRSPGPIGGVLTAGSVLLGVSVVLGCAVGAVMTAGARPQPQDAKTG